MSAVRDPDGTFTAYYYDPYGNLFAFRRGTSTFYVASDHLGTPRVIADSEGTVVDVMEYDSYGSLLSDSNPTFKLAVGFAGGIVDITGLIRFGFRDYDPASGRWVSRDPILYKTRDFNLYGYVQNNPTNSMDRNGLSGSMVSALPIAGGFAAADGPLPVGDIVSSVILVGSGVYDLWQIWKKDNEDPVVFPDTPDTAPSKFRKKGGKNVCDDGSVWEKDHSGHGGDQWKRWPSEKDYEKGRKPSSVWPNGRIRK